MRSTFFDNVDTLVRCSDVIMRKLNYKHFFVEQFVYLDFFFLAGLFPREGSAKFFSILLPVKSITFCFCLIGLHDTHSMGLKYSTKTS